MSILQISNIPSPTSYHEYTISIELLRRGKQIMFINPFRLSTDILSMFRERNVYIIRNVEPETMRLLASPKRLTDIKSPDIIYCHDFLHPEKSITAKYLFKKFKETKPTLILDSHTFYFLEKSRLSNIKISMLKLLSRELVKKAKLIYATSAAVFKYLISRIHIPEEKVKQLELCVDTNMFSPKHKKHSMFLREKIGIPKDALVLITVGGIRPYKRLELVIDAFSKLIKNENLTPKDIIFIIIGNGGNYSNYLQKLSINLGLFDKYVKFLGRVEWIKLPKYYAMSDLAIFTAPTVSILEALASGLPLLCYKYFPSKDYRYAHTGDVYCYYNNCFLFELIPKDIYLTLKSVINLSDKELKRMSYYSRKLAKEKYSCKIVVDQLIKDLSKVDK